MAYQFYGTYKPFAPPTQCESVFTIWVWVAYYASGNDALLYRRVLGQTLNRSSLNVSVFDAQFFGSLNVSSLNMWDAEPV